MKVEIKDFAVNMEIKNKGVEFQVHTNKGDHKGDCYVTKTGLIWCRGRTPRKNGKQISWDEFADWMEGQ